MYKHDLNLNFESEKPSQSNKEVWYGKEGRIDVRVPKPLNGKLCIDEEPKVKGKGKITTLLKVSFVVKEVLDSSVVRRLISLFIDHWSW